MVKPEGEGRGRRVAFGDMRVFVLQQPTVSLEDMLDAAHEIYRG